MRALAFVAIQVAVAAVLSGAYVRDIGRGTHYLSAWRDKERLLLETPSPRLVLVGGSNLAFGVDSKVLGRSLGRHVVNLGLHASVGREFMLRWAEAGLRPGDLVLISLEYERFCDAQGDETLIYLIERQPEAARYASMPELVRLVLDQGLNLLGGVPKSASLHWRGFAEQPVTPPYARAAFNAWGDVVAHHGMRPKEPKIQFMPVCREGAVRQGIERVNEFARSCRAKKATPVFSFPAVPAPSFQTPGNRLGWLGRRVQAGLQMPVLGSPEETGYPPQAFYDTTYHLTRRAKTRRTEWLVERLLQVPEVTRRSPDPEP